MLEKGSFLPQLRRKTEKLGKGQLEDRKSGMMEENEISGKKKKCAFRERRGVWRLWRAENGQRGADGSWWFRGW